MRFLRFVVGLGLAVLLHAVAIRLWPQAPLTVDLFLVLVVLNALGGRTLTGIAGGLAAGLVQDVLTGGLFGLYGFADTMIGYAVARGAQRLVIERASGIFPVAAAAVVVQQAVVVGLVHLLFPEPRMPDLRWIAVEAGTTGLITTAAFAFGGWWLGFSEQRRRQRMQRLHLD